ncbi:MAG: hypothetical protein ACRYG4_21235 [Janthinobacterium lividum]
MALYRIIGEHLISDDEYARKGDTVTAALAANGRGGAAHPSVALQSGRTLSFDAPIAAAQPAALTAFPPIAYGQPLTIDIRQVYSGKVHWRDLSGTGDIAVVSGVKNWSVFNASARALNFVAKHTGANTMLPMPGALTDGTAIVAYVPAVATEQLLVSFELTGAPRDDGVLATLSSAFQAAATMPLFLPYQGAIMAAGSIIPLAGKLIGALTNGSSMWSETETVNFGKPGTTASVADFRLAARAGSGLEAYTYRPDVGLVDNSGALYNGDEPYIVIAIYGGQNSELEGFAPAVASAELLKRFYGAQNGVGNAIGDLIDIVKLASDVKNRRAADQLKARIAAAGGADTTKLTAQLAATVANILDPTLRP